MNDAAHDTISVVVCCHTTKRLPLLRRALRSLEHQSHSVREIIVVVDNNDALYEHLASALTDIRLVANCGFPGLSGARNTGAAVATGTIVAFLDDDARVDRDWAKYLIDAYQHHDVGAVGGTVLADFEGGRPVWFPSELDWIVGCTYSGHRTEAGSVRNLIGANMSFRRQLLSRLGGFRADLGRRRDNALGCEETELCIRAQQVCNARIWFEPRAVAYHYVPRDRTTLHYMRRRCLQEGRSKAIVAAVAGTDVALDAERSYVTRTLPLAIWREVVAFVRSADSGAVRRATALCFAPLATAVGYAAMRWHHR
ncbi:MAG TPA: glycosyltransferase [Acidimicrobiia bacterium]|nr:glycosyltransferase [Acidimicrobiia bacterium]